MELIHGYPMDTGERVKSKPRNRRKRKTTSDIWDDILKDIESWSDDEYEYDGYEARGSQSVGYFNNNENYSWWSNWAPQDSRQGGYGNLPNQNMMPQYTIGSTVEDTRVVVSTDFQRTTPLEVGHYQTENHEPPVQPIIANLGAHPRVRFGEKVPEIPEIAEPVVVELPKPKRAKKPRMTDEERFMGFVGLMKGESRANRMSTTGWQSKPVKDVTDHQQTTAIKNLMINPFNHKRLILQLQTCIRNNPQNLWVPVKEFRSSNKMNESVYKKSLMFADHTKPMVIPSRPQFIHHYQHDKDIFARINPVYFHIYHNCFDENHNFKYEFYGWSKYFMDDTYDPENFFYKQFTKCIPKNQCIDEDKLRERYCMFYENRIFEKHVKHGFVTVLRTVYQKHGTEWFPQESMKTMLDEVDKHLFYRLYVFADPQYPAPVSSRPGLLFSRTNKTKQEVEVRLNPMCVEILLEREPELRKVSGQ